MQAQRPAFNVIKMFSTANMGINFEVAKRKGGNFQFRLYYRFIFSLHRRVCLC